MYLFISMLFNTIRIKQTRHVLMNAFSWRQTNGVRKQRTLCSLVSHNNSNYNDSNPIGDHFDSVNANAIQTISDSMKVIDNFVSDDEETQLLSEVEAYITCRRLRYETSHWDNAIQNYRETEKLDWNECNARVIDRIRSVAFPPNVPQIKFVHVLDLAKTGFIKPHIDSVRFCGDIITGLSLMSASVMRLAAEDNKEIFVDVLLNRRSLYIMSGDSRHKFTHEILPNELSKFKGIAIPKDRRISIICRNEPNYENRD